MNIMHMQITAWAYISIEPYQGVVYGKSKLRHFYLLFWKVTFEVTPISCPLCQHEDELGGGVGEIHWVASEH